MDMHEFDKYIGKNKQPESELSKEFDKIIKEKDYWIKKEPLGFESFLKTKLFKVGVAATIGL